MYQETRKTGSSRIPITGHTVDAACLGAVDLSWLNFVQMTPLGSICPKSGQSESREADDLMAHHERFAID